MTTPQDPRALIERARTWTGDNTGTPATMLRGLAKVADDEGKRADKAEADLAHSRAATDATRNEADKLVVKVAHLEQWAKGAMAVIDVVRQYQETRQVEICAAPANEKMRVAIMERLRLIGRLGVMQLPKGIP